MVIVVPQPLTPTGMASTASDVAEGRAVIVSPPLFASAASDGGVLCTSPVPMNPQVLACSRLYPSDATAPLQSMPKNSFPTMELAIDNEPATTRMPAPTPGAPLVPF